MDAWATLVLCACGCGLVLWTWGSTLVLWRVCGVCVAEVQVPVRGCVMCVVGGFSGVGDLVVGCVGDWACI